MRKFIAIITAFLLTLPIFSGLFAGAQQSEFSAALLAAEKELYGVYTAQSALYLRDTYSKAVATNEPSLTAELNIALSQLTKLENYTRIPLGSFETITSENIAKMSLCRGNTNASGGKITLSGEGLLRYCNATNEGIVGASPFGIATPFADGFILTVASDTDCRLSLEIGRRGSESDCTFVISNIAISEGERKYFFDFDLFGNLPLDGTLNYISLTFEGACEVTFGDLHAAANTAENTAPSCSEAALTSRNFSTENYYKLLQRDTNLALTITEDEVSKTKILSFTESVENDASQLWKFCPDPENSSRYRIVSKLYGLALAPTENTTPSLCAKLPSLVSEAQAWSVTYTKAKGFSFSNTSNQRISYAQSRPTLTNTVAKNFDILEVTGENWTLVWSDEFNGTSLDRNVWFPMEGSSGKDNEPYYNRDSTENVYLEDGNLVIKTIAKNYNGMPSTAGHVTTEDKVLFGYGRFEMYAKLPEGNKIWPAFWMMGDDDVWPYSGEIDILEMIGSDSYDDYAGNRKAIATFHYSGPDGAHRETGGPTHGGLITSEKLSDDYHIYAVEWDENQLRWYFDDTLYFTLNIDTPDLRNALQENPMYLRLSSAMDGPGDFKLPENFPYETSFLIDYVRYYRAANAAMPADTLPYQTVRDTVTLRKDLMGYVNTCAVSPAHDLLVYANSENHLIVFDAAKLTDKGYWKPNDWQYAYVKSSAVSADGRTVVFGKEGEITVDEIEMKSPLTFKFDSYTPTVALSNDGSRIYAGGIALTSNPYYCNYFRIFNSLTGKEVSSEHTGSWVDSIAVAADDKYAYGCFDGMLRIRTADGENVGEFALNERIVSLLFSNNSDKLYIADGANNIYVYSFTDGLLTHFATCPDGIYMLSLSPDGSRLAVACGDSCARVFDAESGKLLYRPSLGRLVVTNALFSVDGSLLVLSGTDGKIGIYRADDGLPLVMLSDKNTATVYNTVLINSDLTRVVATHTSEKYYSGIHAWRLPANLVVPSADTSSLEKTEYIDRCIYTDESYAEYSSALGAANAVRSNRYSTEEQITQATERLKAAKTSLKEKPNYLKGDFDFDEQISVADALAALRIAAKMTACTATDLALGDIDKDGNITVSDALLSSA